MKPERKESKSKLSNEDIQYFLDNGGKALTHSPEAQLLDQRDFQEVFSYFREQKKRYSPDEQVAIIQQLLLHRAISRQDLAQVFSELKNDNDATISWADYGTHGEKMPRMGQTEKADLRRKRRSDRVYNRPETPIEPRYKVKRRKHAKPFLVQRESAIWRMQLERTAIFAASVLGMEDNGELIMDLYPHLPDYRPDLREKIEENVIRDNRQFIPRILAHTDVSKFRVTYEVQGQKRVPVLHRPEIKSVYHSVLQRRVNKEIIPRDGRPFLTEVIKSPESASDFVETMLDDYEHAENKDERRDYWKNYIQQIGNVSFMLHPLLPHLARIEQAGILSSQEVKEYAFPGTRNDGLEFTGTLPNSFGETQEDKDKISEIEKRYKALYPDDEIGDINFQELPVHLELELNDLRAQQVQRSADYFFQHYSQYRGLLTRSEQVQFLESLAEGSIPTILYAEQLGLTDQELKQVLSRMDGNSMFYSRTYLEVDYLCRKGFGDHAVKALCDSRTGASENAVHYLARFQEVMTSEQFAIVMEYYGRRFELLNRNPDFFLQNIDEFRAIVDAESNNDLLERYLREMDFYSFVSYVRRIERIVSELDEDNSMKDILKSVLVSRLHENRIYALRFNKKIQHLLSREELDSIVQAGFTEPQDIDLIQELLVSGDPNLFKGYESELQIFIEAHPEVVAYLFGGYGLVWESVMSLLPEREKRLDFFERVVRYVDYADVFESKENRLLLDLVASKRGKQILTSYLEQEHRVELLSHVIKRLSQDEGSTALVKYYEGLFEEWILENVEQVFSQKVLEFFGSGARAKLFWRLVSADTLLDYCHNNLSSVQRIFDDLPSWQSAQSSVLDEIAAKLSTQALVMLEDIPIPLEIRIKQKILSENHLIAVEEFGYKEGYYEEVISRLSTLAAFPYFEARLEAIAKKLRKKNGAELNPYSEKDDEFVTLARRLMLVEAGGFPIDSDGLRSLSPDQLDNLFELYDLYVRLGGALSDHPMFDDISAACYEGDCTGLVDLVSSSVYSLLAERFSLPSNQVEEFEQLSTSSIIAFEQYYSTTCEGRQDMTSLAIEALHAYLSGNYDEWRFFADFNDSEKAFEHFQENGILPQGLSRTQYAQWVEESSTNLDAILEISANHIVSHINDIFRQAIENHHIDQTDLDINTEELLSDYAGLVQPLRSLSERFKQLKSKADSQGLSSDESVEYDEIRSVQVELRNSMKAKQAKIEAQLFLQKLRNVSIADISSKVIHIGTREITYKAGFRLLRQHYNEHAPEFSRDIDRMEETFFSRSSEISRTQLFVSDAVDFETMLMIGENPVPSCQSYKGDVEYNRGLLSFIGDPNVKMVQVRSDDGTFIARSALRLMQAADGTPILYAEDVYSTNAHPKIREAVARFVQQKADSLGIRYSIHGRHGSDRIVLKQTGSRSPFVYTDNGGGLRRHGIFSIDTSYAPRIEKKS